ncbi:lysine biosynthesis protein LysW [Candidatus Bathyarchaeota archaeon]|nr:lysine biosynthesis protein LysW [Candidatus Bathyarchaeota archaeon]
MSVNCTDCGGIIEIPENAEVDEIIECPDCGLEYVVVEMEHGLLSLKELALKGEDWGE